MHGCRRASLLSPRGVGSGHDHPLGALSAVSGRERATLVIMPALAWVPPGVIAGWVRARPYGRGAQALISSRIALSG